MTESEFAEKLAADIRRELASEAELVARVRAYTLPIAPQLPIDLYEVTRREIESGELA